MRLDIHVHDERTRAIMSALTDLQAQVAATQAEITTAVAKINALAAAVTAAPDDPALAQLSQDLATSTESLAAVDK